MATTNYHTVNGEIIGETTSSVRTGYLTDGLGSVTATQGSTGNVLATYRYKPYGTLLAKTGAGSDPRFLWVGSLGYRTTQLDAMSHYVRARCYASILAAWGALDPVWPIEPGYVYVRCKPTTLVDPDGLGPCDDCKKLRPVAKISSAAPLCKWYWKEWGSSMPPQLAGYVACCNEKKVVQGCLTEFTERFAKDLDKLKAGVGGVYLRSVVANEQYHVDNAKKPFVSCSVYTGIGAGLKKNNCGRLGYVDVNEDLVLAEECNSDKASFAVLTKEWPKLVCKNKPSVECGVTCGRCNRMRSHCKRTGWWSKEKVWCDRECPAKQ